MWKQYPPQSRKQGGSNLEHKAGSKVEAISNTKQEAKWQQVDPNRMPSGCKVEAKAWNMLEGMVLPLRH
jgi:hypothetical protein